MFLNNSQSIYNLFNAWNANGCRHNVIDMPMLYFLWCRGLFSTFVKCYKCILNLLRTHCKTDVKVGTICRILSLLAMVFKCKHNIFLTPLCLWYINKLMTYLQQTYYNFGSTVENLTIERGFPIPTKPMQKWLQECYNYVVIYTPRH